MSDVAAYHVLVCALFPVQGGMWTQFREIAVSWAITPYQYLIKLPSVLYNLCSWH